MGDNRSYGSRSTHRPIRSASAGSGGVQMEPSPFGRRSLCRSCWGRASTASLAPSRKGRSPVALPSRGPPDQALADRPFCRVGSTLAGPGSGHGWSRRPPVVATIGHGCGVRVGDHRRSRFPTNPTSHSTGQGGSRRRHRPHSLGCGIGGSYHPHIWSDPQHRWVLVPPLPSNRSGPGVSTLQPPRRNPLSHRRLRLYEPHLGRSGLGLNRSHFLRLARPSPRHRTSNGNDWPHSSTHSTKRRIHTQPMCEMC